jgi:hypothetical protein
VQPVPSPPLSARANATELELIGEVELEVKGPPPVREPTRHSLDVEQVRTVPGNGGDVLRAVESMPGVARPAWGSGQLIVRGAAPEDSLVFVDGTPIPFAYHLGDTNSVVPGDLLERLDFYPGNFGPRFGRGMGGVIDVGLRAPRRDRFGGLAQVDVVDGRLMVEGPLGERTAVLLAARRSWLDAWLGEALSDADTSVNAAPVYWDAQALLEHEVSSRTRARISLFGADDRFELLIKTPDSRDPAFAGTIGGYSRFLRTQLRLEHEPCEELRLNTTFSWGISDVDQRFGSNGFAWRAHEFTVRSELRVQVVPALALIAGLDTLWSFNDVRARFQPYPEDGSADAPYFGRPARSATADVALKRPGAYAGLELTPLPALKLMPSVRVDYASDTGDVTLDPRLGARWDVVQASEHTLRTSLKGGLGLYHQPPRIEQSAPGLGNEDVSSSRALHASLGIEQALADGLELSLEGFHKRLSQLIVARADESRLIGARFVNEGEGRVYGAELLGRYRGEWLQAVLAYTLSRSERRDDPDERYRVFEHDQTHILSLVGSVDLGRRWTLGARFRYVTGRPYTPYVGGLVDLDAGSYAAIAGEPYSARLRAFHQLDLRIEKTWDFTLWTLAAYLELRNAYNHRSVENVAYSHDYAERKPVEGLPILPVVGLRGEL